MSRLQVTLLNRSAWPTPALEVIANWVARAAGIQWRYKVLVRSCKSNTWGGRGSRTFQRLWLDRHFRRSVRTRRPSLECLKARLGKAQSEYDHFADDRPAHQIDAMIRRIDTLRRAIATDRVPCEKTHERLWPFDNKDHRFQWSDNQSFKTRLELLVFLMAHEACHATTGHPDEHYDARKDCTDRAGMEYHCNARGYRILERFREEWPTIHRRIYEAMRKVRHKKEAKLARTHDPNRKGAKAEGLLKQWLCKQKYATTKVKKYQRRVRYYRRKSRSTFTAASILAIGEHK